MAWNAEAWTRRLSHGFDTHRVEFAVYPHDLDRAITEGLVTGEPLPGDRSATARGRAWCGSDR